MEAARNGELTGGAVLDVALTQTNPVAECEVGAGVNAWHTQIRNRAHQTLGKKGTDFDEGRIKRKTPSGKAVMEWDASSGKPQERHFYQLCKGYTLTRCCRDKEVDLSEDEDNSEKIAANKAEIEIAIEQLESKDYTGLAGDYAFSSWTDGEHPFYGRKFDNDYDPTTDHCTTKTEKLTKENFQNMLIRHVQLMRLQMFQVRQALLEKREGIDAKLKDWFGADVEKARFQVIRTMHLIQSASQHLHFVYAGERAKKSRDGPGLYFAGQPDGFPQDAGNRYTIEIGSAFFLDAAIQPVRGTLASHRAAVIYHEMTHLIKKDGACSGDPASKMWSGTDGDNSGSYDRFDRGQIGTYDWMYWPENCLKLAKEHPDQARHNADSHAFFVNDVVNWLSKDDPDREYGIYGNHPDPEYNKHSKACIKADWDEYLDMNPEIGALIRKAQEEA